MHERETSALPFETGGQRPDLFRHARQPLLLLLFARPQLRLKLPYPLLGNCRAGRGRESEFTLGYRLSILGGRKQLRADRQSGVFAQRD
jgi:hypothetical protein